MPVVNESGSEGSQRDLGDILDYLRDAGLINEFEYGKFDSDAWDCIVETSENMEEPEEKDDDESEEDDD